LPKPVGTNGQSPDKLDGERGMAWWNALSDEDRRYWLALSLGTSPADAWEYFKRCTKPSSTGPGRSGVPLSGSQAPHPHILRP